MYRSILVPLDGSQSSEHALPYAAALARRSGAALQIAYVHTPLVMGEGAMYLARLEPQLCADEKKYVAGIIERLQGAGLDKVSGRVLEGPIAESLQEFALSEGSDLVVMTTHGRGPVSRFWLGSVADQLVHRLPMPLLLLRTREEGPPPGEPTFHNILVALDGTPTAEQILEPVGELAKLMEANLTLLRVLLIPKGAGAFPSEQQWAKGHTHLDRVAASLREKGIAVNRCLLADAHPAAAILEEAESGGYDLLALATRGRRGLPRLFLGSVADKVVRGASVPVLVHRCLPG